MVPKTQRERVATARSRERAALAAIAGRHQRALGVIAALASAEALLVLAQPWPLKFAVDNAIGHRRFPAPLSILDPLGTFGRTAVAIACSLAIVAAASALSYVLTMRATRTSEAIGAELRQQLIERILELGEPAHRTHGTGELTSRVTSDVSRVEDAVVSVSSTVVPELLTLVGMVIVIARIDLALAAAAAAVVPLLWAVTKRRRLAVRAAERASRDAVGQLTATTVELIRQAPLLHELGQEHLASRRYRHQSRRTVDRVVHAAAIDARYRPIADLLVAAVGGLCLAIGVTRVASGAMTVGTLLVLLAYMSRVFGPVRALSSLGASLAKVGASHDRLREVLDTPAAVAIGGTRPAPGAPAVVDVRGVCFGYRPGEPVLRSVSCTIPAKALVAVVGPSGAGKSTLLRLLRRGDDPTGGDITLDGTPLAAFDPDALREHVAHLAQGGGPVRGSVVENIALGRPGAAFHEVLHAARLARADNFVRALPRGYDTVLGEDGIGLSGGQQRRIALARTVLRAAPLLLLDEPTAGLDGASSREVVASIQSIANGRTVVVATHDRSLALCADLVVVLDGGSVAEVGSPAALLSAGGPFTRLWGTSHGLDHQQQGECSHEQGIGMLGPLRRRPRWVGQVRQVEEVPQVAQVQQVAEVGRLLNAGTGGGHDVVTSPTRVAAGSGG